MKRIVTLVMVLILVAFVASPSFAQGRMSLSVGPDVLIPVGTFADNVKTGFGGTVRFQYEFTPMLAAGLEAGYFTWTAKDLPSGVSASLNGVPVRVFGKYYFMPESAPTRVYGMVELGLFFGSAKATRGNLSASVTETDFNYCPVVGVEFPAGRTMKIDVSVRYDGIAKTGNTAGNIGGRVGLNFPI